MINFENLIQSLIAPLVIYKEDIVITLESSSEEGDNYQVLVNKADLGRVIGKSGHIATAIRTIVYAAASKENKKVHISIDSK